jgi:hypothetical protein
MKFKLNPNHISGIYNYCDRWCERCSFTTRCSVYEHTSPLTPDQNDINNKAFWENISQNFVDTLTLLSEAAAKHGIDLNAVTDEEMKAYQSEEKKKDDKNEKHPLIKYAKLYSNLATDFCKQDNLLTDKGIELQQQVELGIKGIDETEKELATLNDCYEIVQWYMYQIYVKLKRAMCVFDDEAAEDEFMMSDANGSAKVAMIGTDRSIIAWEKMMQLLPAAEYDILHVLALLQKIRLLTEKQFPNARSFKRPGFDE